MFASNVQPKRVVKDAPIKDWRCPSCKTLLRYYWVSCPHDGTRRPS